MALTNYTTLQAAVASWLNRADLTTQIPDFIQLAESRLNRTLRARQMESRINFTISSEYATVPNDWLEFRSGYIDTSPRTPLVYQSPETQTAGHSSTDTRQVYFSIAGDSFRFDPLTVTGDVVMLYYAKIPPLSLNTTNWLLTEYPDAYLYGAIMQAAAFIQNDERVPGVKAMYDDVISQITYASTRARWGGPAMVARPG